MRFIIALATVVTGTLLALWLWSRFCRFPSIPWNDMRLAPTIAFARGAPVYATASDGVISTWMYGPLPLLFFWPASWAQTAADALLVAGALNILLTVVPLALVCFAWPGEDRGRNLMGRGAALLLCLAVWPELHYSVHFSDNLAIAFGLIGNLILVRSQRTPSLWLAAVLATAAVGCKQICVGIPAAQILWIGIVHGHRLAVHHAFRCIIAGVVIGLSALIGFGWEGLRFTLIDVPANLSWTPELGSRLGKVAAVLALHVALPAAVMWIFRHVFRRPTLLLPALAWTCTLPLGLAALLKVGGWTNSIHSFVLWLPPVLAAALTAERAERRLRVVQLATLLLAGSLASVRLVAERGLSLRPQIAAYRQAEQIAASFPRAVWFPVHPLVTLYAENRYYHDEDGLYIRMQAGMPVSAGHMVEHLPAAMRAMAFRNDWMDWGIARGMLPPNSQPVNRGDWTLWMARAEPPQP